MNPTAMRFRKSRVIFSLIMHGSNLRSRFRQHVGPIIFKIFYFSFTTHDPHSYSKQIRLCLYPHLLTGNFGLRLSPYSPAFTLCALLPRKLHRPRREPEVSGERVRGIFAALCSDFYCKQCFYVYFRFVKILPSHHNEQLFILIQLCFTID